MDAGLRVAHQKLSVLQLAESLRNVSEVCRWVSRTQFYEYKRISDSRDRGFCKKPISSHTQIQSSHHTSRAGMILES